MFKRNFTANVIAPKSRISDYLLYCTYLLNLKKIRFNNCVDYNFSKLLILDQEMLESFIKKTNEDIKLYKKLDYLIFIWNGQFDYIRNYNAIEKLEKRIKKRVTIHVSGNKFLIKNRKIKKFQKFYIIKNIPEIKGISIAQYLFFRYPILKSVILSFMYPYLFLSNFFCKKILFVGYGKLKNLDLFLSHKKNNYITSYGYKIVKKFFNLVDKDLSSRIFFLYKLAVNKKFLKIINYEKYLILQCIYRHLFILVMEKFKNFKYFENDKGLSLNSSPIYKKNYSIDLGSKLGNDKFYQRSIILKKTYQNNMLRFNFFSKDINTNAYFKKNIFKMYYFLESLNNIKKINYTADELQSTISICFRKILNK
jgi:hypothetical protein